MYWVEHVEDIMLAYDDEVAVAKTEATEGADASEDETPETEAEADDTSEAPKSETKASASTDAKTAVSAYERKKQ